ncbi:MAG: hypothetical protein FRX49_02955 [Trebouxia sp. A1-2]|nr:MAG: hypothetical protein FRX49_02955 [Trebouxia sp. A1-2]
MTADISHKRRGDLLKCASTDQAALIAKQSYLFCAFLTAQSGSPCTGGAAEFLALPKALSRSGMPFSSRRKGPIRAPRLAISPTASRRLLKQGLHLLPTPDQPSCASDMRTTLTKQHKLELGYADSALGAVGTGSIWKLCASFHIGQLKRDGRLGQQPGRSSRQAPFGQQQNEEPVAVAGVWIRAYFVSCASQLGYILINSGFWAAHLYE